jgi:FK506-binding protein 2
MHTNAKTSKIDRFGSFLRLRSQNITTMVFTMATPPMLLRLARLSFVLLGLQLVSSLSLSIKPNLSSAKNSPIPLSPDLGHRRAFLCQALLGTTSLLLTVAPDKAAAVVTDETDNFADNYWSTGKGAVADSTAAGTEALASDELIVSISKKDLLNFGLGLEIADVEFRSNRRVFVKSVMESSLASRLGIRSGWVIIAVNGQSTERTNAKGVTQMIGAAVKNSMAVEFTFRDPSLFREQLQNMPANGESVTTQVAPAGDTTQRNADGSVKFGKSVTQQEDQRVTVSQLVAPKACTKQATTDDLLEISYVGKVVETGKLFDGSAIMVDGKGIPGRGNDVTLQFVLGKQPFGQFPPGWDVALVGMCSGERRRVIVPPAMGFGSKGVPKRKIPPDATLQYDITLVSVNGIAIP